MNSYIRRLVERGASWLDRHYPDWEFRINLKTLYLAGCQQCVLGQLTGGFNVAVEQHRLCGLDVAQCGFYLPRHWIGLNGDHNHLFGSPMSVWYDALTREWKQFILERRKERKDGKRTATAGHDSGTGAERRCLHEMMVEQEVLCGV